MANKCRIDDKGDSSVPLQIELSDLKGEKWGRKKPTGSEREKL